MTIGATPSNTANANLPAKKSACKSPSSISVDDFVQDLLQYEGILIQLTLMRGMTAKNAIKSLYSSKFHTPLDTVVSVRRLLARLAECMNLDMVQYTVVTKNNFRVRSTDTIAMLRRTADIVNPSQREERTSVKGTKLETASIVPPLARLGQRDAFGSIPLYLNDAVARPKGWGAPRSRLWVVYRDGKSIFRAATAQATAHLPAPTGKAVVYQVRLIQYFGRTKGFPAIPNVTSTVIKLPIARLKKVKAAVIPASQSGLVLKKPRKIAAVKKPAAKSVKTPPTKRKV